MYRGSGASGNKRVIRAIGETFVQYHPSKYVKLKLKVETNVSVSD